MKYFEGLTEENLIKAKYKELAKTHHPDRGGRVETMKEVNRQYESVLTGLYQKAGKRITEIDELFKTDLLIREKLTAILSLDGLIIEICGNWLLIKGQTKDHNS